MPQAHTLTAPASSRIRRLTPLVAVIAACALFALTLIQSIADDPPAVEESAVSVSRALTERPAESAVAAAVGGAFDSAHWSQHPDESTVAAAVGPRLDSGQWLQRPEESTVATAVSQAMKSPPPGPTGGIRYDGGPEEGSSGALVSSADSNAVRGIRYDGGPEEGGWASGR